MAKRIVLPKLGMRIVKTALAILITLIITDLILRRAFKIESFVSEYAAISAALTIQDSIRSSYKFAFERLFGTVIGAVIGAGFLAIDLLCGKNIFVLYALVSVGAVLVIYLCKVIKRVSASSLCVVVFLAVMFARSAANPYLRATIRVVETAIGAVVAILVNLLFFRPKSVEVKQIRDEFTIENINDIDTAKSICNDIICEEISIEEPTIDESKTAQQKKNNDFEDEIGCTCNLKNQNNNDEKSSEKGEGYCVNEDKESKKDNS